MIELEASVLSLTTLMTGLIGFLVVGVLAVASGALGIYAIRFGIRKLKAVFSAGS